MDSERYARQSSKTDLSVWRDIETFRDESRYITLNKGCVEYVHLDIAEFRFVR